MDLRLVKDMSDYAMDVDSGQLFSYKNGRKKSLCVYKRARRGRKVCDVYVEGKKRTLGHARLWFAVLNNIGYDEVPSDMVVFEDSEGRPRLGTVTERTQKSVRRRLEMRQKYRAAIIDRKISELELMREFYQDGDASKILAYVEELRGVLLEWFRHSVGASEQKATDVFNAAYVALCDRLECRTTLVCDIMAYVKGLMMKENRRMVRERHVASQQEYDVLRLKSTNI